MSLPSSASVSVPPGFALQPDEATLAACLNELSDPVLITRADLARPGPTIVGVSPGLAGLTGYTSAELVGRSPRLFQGPLTDPAVLVALRRACERGEQFVGETVNYRKGGAAYLVQWTVDPMHDQAGRITHYFSLQQDVTEQRPFAQAWLEAESKARRTMEQASAQMTLIAEAILVLEKTKRSFRSKELGELRERLLRASVTAESPSSPVNGAANI